MLQSHTKETKKVAKIMERSIFSSRNCFLENLKEHDMINESGFEEVKEWYEFIIASPQINLEVDLIVYIKTSPEVAWSRIKQRGRSGEFCNDL